MKHNFDNIPKELQRYQQWVVWRYVLNPDNPDKPKKKPIDPKTGRSALVNDPATWGTFESAKKRFNEGDVDGFGFVFTENDPYVGIDLDNCRDKKTGTITDRAQKIISSFASYTELSPSGTGVHIIAKGVLPGKGKKDGNIEMYDQGRYFTFTGETI